MYTTKLLKKLIATHHVTKEEMTDKERRIQSFMSLRASIYSTVRPSKISLAYQNTMYRIREDGTFADPRVEDVW